MKTSLISPLRSLFAGLIFGTASVVFAAPSASSYETMHQPQQFQQLKPGDKIVYVCNQCKTVTEQTITSTEQAMDHCKEGATLTCPSCKAKVKVTSKGPPKNPSLQREVTYTNEKGEECMIIAKVVSAQDNK